MKESFMKDNIIAYAETVISPEVVEQLYLHDTISDAYGDCNVWLVESDTGEEYWVLEGNQTSNIYKKSGIYQDVAHVYAAYRAMLEEEPKETIDRFTFMQ